MLHKNVIVRFTASICMDWDDAEETEDDFIARAEPMALENGLSFDGIEDEEGEDLEVSGL